MPAQNSKPKIILVVDDEPAIVQLMKSQLEFEGYAVMTASNGADAIETAKNASIDVVLLDLGLPDMDGFEVLNKIKFFKPNLPIVIVTGNHQESEGRRAFELGAWDYVTKPVDFKYLKNILLIQDQE